MIATQTLQQRGLRNPLCRLPRRGKHQPKSFQFLITLMIPRYTRPEMGRIWTDQNKFQQWLEVELAASEALAELGIGAGRSGAVAAATCRF